MKWSALTPLGSGEVCGVGCGMGRCRGNQEDYPRCTLCLLDADKDRVETAKAEWRNPLR